MHVDDGALAAWCTAHLGAAPVALLFESGHLAVVRGVRLADGRDVVVKLRPALARIAGCVAVHRHLHAAGYPCPQPLAGPSPLGEGLLATAESLLAAGVQLPADADRSVRFAGALARLVELAPAADAVPSLLPAPPWAWPATDALWPAPDDVAADLNAVAGPQWLDELAAEVRERLLASAAWPAVIGHVDFESQNVRWQDGALHAVHDWDSVAALPEPAVAGLAAAMHTATGAPRTEATEEESARFLDAYQDARGRWDAEQLRVAWAAGLWVRAFNAKKAQARGDFAEVSACRDELEARLRRTR